jgi:hypothetical protein
MFFKVLTGMAVLFGVLCFSENGARADDAVETRPGGSTLVGARQVSSAHKDGCALLVPTATTLSTTPHIDPKSSVNPVRDSERSPGLARPISFLSRRERIEVRSKPGKYVYRSSGVGTPHRSSWIC